MKVITFRPGVKRFSVNEPDDSPPPKKKFKTDSTFKRQSRKPIKQEVFKSALKETTSDYCNNATVDGISYIHLDRHIGLNLLWGCLLIVSLIVCLFMIKTQYSWWQKNPVIVSFAEFPTPVSEIPFPALTVCAETKSIKTDKLDFTRFYKYLRSFGNDVILPPPYLTDEEFKQMRSLLQVCGNFLTEGMHFPEYPQMDMLDYLKMITPSFDQTINLCAFNRAEGSCRQIFDRVYTKDGICYTFNSLNASELYREETYQYKNFEKGDHLRQRNATLDWTIADGYVPEDKPDTYPERVFGGGYRTGLLVSLLGLEVDLDVTCRGPVEGFKLILHSPDDLPPIDRHFIHVPYETDSIIVVKPHLVFNTEDTDQYFPERRNCYFPEERFLRFFKFYTQTNCEIECLANFTLRYCGCVHFAMPRLPDTKVCDASKISCYDKAENEFLLSEFTQLQDDRQRCNCLPGCYTLRYNNEVSQGDLHLEKFLEAYDGEMLDANLKRLKVSHVSVSFKMNEFTAWKRSEIYGLADFLANCGGLLSLFMGVSALSVFEFLYFFTVRLYRNINKSSQY